MQRIFYYLRLVFLFVRMSFSSQLEYRINFISGVLVESGYMCIKLTYLVVVIRAGSNIGTLTPDMILIFIGTYIFMTGIWMLLEGLNSLPNAIFKGQLDLVLTKPCSPLFLQVSSAFNFGMLLPNFVGGLIVIVFGWSRSGIPSTAFNVLGFTFWICCGIFLTYGIVSICMMLAFWITSFNGINTLFAAFWDFNNMPMEIYPKMFRQIGTFIIPVFMITNWPGLFVLKSLAWEQIIWGIMLPVLLLFISFAMWRSGLRRYSSANG